MRIGLRLKILVPVLGLLGLTMGLLALDFDREVEEGAAEALDALLADKRLAVSTAIDQAGARALREAAVFSRLPEVVGAYELALLGDIDDPRDPVVHDQRLRLRQLGEGFVAGLHAVAPEESFQLHFHLPNGRSLLRVWRKTQSLDGRDESDDISGFRPSVMTVNRAPHAAVRGIEVGRGGFAIRGVAPIATRAGRHLGSVEMLVSFGTVTANLDANDSQELAVYMRSDLLGVATKLAKAPDKHPPRGDFVLVSATDRERVDAVMSPEILKAGLAGPTPLARSGDLVGQAWPIEDFRGQPVGVMAFVVDRSAERAAIASARARRYAIGGGAAALLVLMVLIVLHGVIRPIHRLMKVAREVARDTDGVRREVPADLLRHRDEVGRLSRDFAQMLESLQSSRAQAESEHAYLTQSVEGLLAATEAFAGGDLTVRLPPDGDGGLIDQLKNGFNHALENLGSLVRELAGDATSLAAASEELQSIATDLHARTRASAKEVAEVGSFANRINQGMRHMEASTSTLSAAAQEIAASTHHAAAVSETATRSASEATERVLSLQKASKLIAHVVETISDISRQTHLLALNASVEAARAGDAGKGFAIVAGEVGQLAAGTSTAVQDIVTQIGTIQGVIAETVDNIAGIQGVIVTMDDIETSIAQAAAQQATTAHDIGRNASEVADGSDEIAGRLEEVMRGVEMTTAHAQTTAQAADSLAEMATRIQGRMAMFHLPAKGGSRSAPSRPATRRRDRPGHSARAPGPM